MNTIRLFFLLMLSIVLTTITGCKCDNPMDPDCKNYDPCFEVTNSFSDFVMKEKISWYEHQHEIVTDTTLENNTITFQINDPMVDSVTWQIGLESKNRRGKQIQVFFEDPIGEINVTAIAYKKLAGDCCPMSDGIDTTTKTLNILNWYEAKYFGKYSGISNMPDDEPFITRVDTFSYFNGVQIEKYPIALVQNLPNGYSMPIPENGYDQYEPRTWFFYNGFVLWYAEHILELVAIYDDDKKTLNAKFKYQTADYEPALPYTYSGKKI